MSAEDPFGLAPVWDAAVDIYHEIKKICDRHGLRYYMSDGNALGAERHGTFIPWDDDFDLSMPRPDYVRFVEYAEKELPAWLKFVDWENTPEFKFYFGKVQMVDEARVLAVERQVGHRLSNGLFVDIFPIDGYPKGRLDRWRLRASDLMLNLMCRYRTASLSSQKGIVEKIAWILGGGLSMVAMGLRSEADLRSAHERNFLKFPYDQSEFVGRCCTASSVLCREPMLRSSWGVPRMVEFYRGESFPLPQDTPAVLRNEYGDWRQLPPEDQRHPTHEYPQRVPWWIGPTRSICPKEEKCR